MRHVLLLLSAVIALSACGDGPTYEPGTIPASLLFSVVRVSDFEADGMCARRVVSDPLDVGQPTPDFFDGRTAVWRYRTIFGDLIDEPGARIELQHGGTTISKEDPWRTSYGEEFCLVIGGNGSAMAQWVDVKSPRDIESGWATAEVRLRLDESGLAAHRELGVLRVHVRLGGEVVRTLTEDDFQSWSWRLRDKDGQWLPAWSLRALAEDQIGRIVSIRGRDGSSAVINADGWTDAERQPVLRWDGKVLTFAWQDPKVGPPHVAEIRDVTEIQFVREN